MDPTGTLATRRRQILEALQGRPEGVTRQELQGLASLGELDEQAVRRLLAQLVDQGAARVTGQTKARRYFLDQAAALTAAPPLSPEAEACRGPLTLPPAQRPPASYQPGFLAAYRPNETCYLPQEVRTRLASLAGNPMRPLRRRLQADLAWDAVRLESGGWSRDETQRLFERGEVPAGKPLREAQTMVNLKSAIEFMTESGREAAVDPTTLLNLSALLTENLLAGPMEEGRLRSRDLAVPGTAYRPASGRVIAEAFRHLLDRAAEITDLFEQSFFLLVHLSHLHPFSAGNRACALLAANLPFFRSNSTPICFQEVGAELFNEGLLAAWEQNQVALLRDLYVFAYERSCSRYAGDPAAGAGPDPFRLRHRSAIKAVVRAAVLAGETLAEAQRRIRAFAQSSLPREERERFLVAVETELASLHDGNFARYGLRPSEFAAWKPRMRR